MAVGMPRFGISTAIFLRSGLGGEGSNVARRKCNLYKDLTTEVAEFTEKYFFSALSVRSVVIFSFEDDHGKSSSKNKHLWSYGAPPEEVAQGLRSGPAALPPRRDLCGAAWQHVNSVFRPDKKKIFRMCGAEKACAGPWAPSNRRGASRTAPSDTRHLKPDTLSCVQPVGRAVAQALLPVRDAWNASGPVTGRSACATSWQRDAIGAARACMN